MDLFVSLVIAVYCWYLLINFTQHNFIERNKEAFDNFLPQPGNVASRLWEKEYNFYRLKGRRNIHEIKSEFL